MSLNTLTIAESLVKLKKKEISSVELTKACLTRINKTENKINALVTKTEETALDQAKKADELRRDDSTLPLLGIPFVIKDNFSTQGIRTTASSKVLDAYMPPYNATVTKRLYDAGIVLLGKTNMDAWAHGSSTETSDYGSSKNPWNTGFLPGGSSGGTAASVASDQTIAGIGSETAGSIRQPASWCGIVGLKPTYGRISRYGVIAMGSSLDSPGPMTKSVEDSALILQILAGKDENDATTLSDEIPNYTRDMKKDLVGMTIGIADDYFEGVDNEITEAVMQSIKQFEKLGVKIKKIKLFPPKYSIAVYTILQRSEVSSNLARYDGIRYGNSRDSFGDEAKRRIMLGTYTLSAGYYDAYYKKAQQVRTLIINDFTKAFQDVSVILAPTSPSTALPLGASKGHPMFGEMADVLVEPSSIAGLPGINIPCGFSRTGLPIGLQLIGKHLSESTLINLAYKFEESTNFHTKKPNL